MQLEQCTNCDLTIGKLETAHIHNGNVVCLDCKVKLDKNERGMLQNLPRGFDGEDLATQAEIKIARQLGLTIAENATRYQVRKLIDRTTGKEEPKIYDKTPPTEKQIKFANHLGIQSPQAMSRGQLSDEIDIKLAQQVVSPPSYPSSYNAQRVINNNPRCQLCGGVMVRSKTGRHFLVSLIVNLCFLIFGILLCFIPLLLIIGIPMILIALFRQSNRKKVLKCTQCGVIVDRA